MKIDKEKSLNPMVDRMIEELTSDENTLRFGPWCMHPYNERKCLIYYNKLLLEQQKDKAGKTKTTVVAVKKDIKCNNKMRCEFCRQEIQQ